LPTLLDLRLLYIDFFLAQVQAFNGILDTGVQSVTIGRETDKLTDRFGYLGSDVGVTASYDLEVNK
jgi:hypothetical protein